MSSGDQTSPGYATPATGSSEIVLQEPPSSQPPLFSVTRLLVAINVLMFIVVTISSARISGHVTLASVRQAIVRPSSIALLRWGADYGPLTLDSQWWRLLANIFIHVGLVHLFLNRWCLLNIGDLAEHIYGRARVVFLYLFTGVTASLVSLWWHPTLISAGASGAIFGFVGALLLVFRFGRLPFPAGASRRAYESLLLFAIYNI